MGLTQRRKDAKVLLLNRRKETGEQKAQRIVLEAMKRLAELPEAGTADR